jgi:hypothetical protein
MKIMIPYQSIFAFWLLALAAATDIFGEAFSVLS